MLFSGTAAGAVAGVAVGIGGCAHDESATGAERRDNEVCAHSKCGDDNDGSSDNPASAFLGSQLRSHRRGSFWRAWRNFCGTSGLPSSSV